MAEWSEQRSRLVRWVGLLAVTLLALYLCWKMLEPFLEVVLWAVVLVIVFFPVHRRVRARVGSPGWSALLSCLLVIFVILVPLTLLTLAVVNELSDFAQMLQPKPDGTGGAARAAAYEMMPLSDDKAREIIDRTGEVIGASVYGVLVIAVIQGVLGGLAFWVLGLPSPLLWGVVMIFLSMIPMLGAFIVWVPAAIYLGLTGHWGKALALALWGALVIGSVDNFLRPKLVGERTRLHELLIFFSVLGGLQVFGILGIVLGPVIVAITIALLDVLRQADGHTREPPERDTLIEQQSELRAAPGES